jgi:hypothetical protein
VAVNDIVGTNAIAGPADIYTGLFGATEPADSTVNTSPPASSWTFAGGTLGGATINFNQAFFTLRMDQTPYPIGNRPTEITPQIVVEIAEPTLANLKIALINNGTVTPSASYSTYDPPNDVTVYQPTYLAMILHGWAPSSSAGVTKRRMLIARKVLSTANIGVPYKRDAQTVFPVTFTSHYVSGSIKPFHIVDEL